MLAASSCSPQRRTVWAMALLSLAGLVFGGQAVAQDEPATDQPTVESLFEDFLHFARMGRFELAESRAEQLLNHPDLDPAELVPVADRDPRSLQTLMMIIRNSSIGDSAQKVLELLREGERILRRDVDRIRNNIQKLGGPPQQEHYATEHLIEAGEYAVPWMLHALADPEKSRLHERILRALPKVGQSAVRPLAAALATDDESLRVLIVQALGRIGYAQAVPHLLKLMQDTSTGAATRAAAERALRQISMQVRRPLPTSTAPAFLWLANQYYQEEGSVAADPRDPVANVWQWNPETRFVEATEVATPLFGPVMAMRSTENALIAEPGNDQAIALWLAADIRREARMGLDVESADPGIPDPADATRPEDFPRALYFTQTAGPRYAHLVLARAVRDGDAQVALGAIAALRETAGASSLIGAEDHKQPLVQALEFPDRVVRMRAALALGNALPKSQFRGAAKVMPVLAQALAAKSAETFVVVDPDEDRLNRVATSLRDGGANVIAEADFYKAVDRARQEADAVGAFFLSTGIKGPRVPGAIESLRAEYAYSRTPVVLIVEATGRTMAEELSQRLNGVGYVVETVRTELLDRLDAVRAKSGEVAMTEDRATSLALEAAEVLHRIALSGTKAFDVSVAESALIAALAPGNEELRAVSLRVLSQIGSENAQRAIAEAALDEANGQDLRRVAFDALADSAKTSGNRLTGSQVDRVLALARDTSQPIMQASASKALGALNLADNKASEIIRSFHDEPDEE